jgi:hypothetical protein
MKNETSLITELRKIFAAINIVSPTSFLFAGKLFDIADPAMRPLQLQGFYPTQTPLVLQLQQQLYQHCYCQRFQGYLSDPSASTHVEDNFLQILATANQSRDLWDSGWQIYQMLPSGQILARKGDLIRTVWGGGFMTQDGLGTAPRVGAVINLFAPRESRTIQPGFYFVFGEALLDDHDLKDFLRFYWNVQAEGASTLIQSITQTLNRFQVPFRFKCLSNRAFFNRVDSAVLFVSKRFYRITAELLTDIYPNIQKTLQSDSPLFSQQLAPGLGLAEDPGTGESFGMHRCRLVAEGLWNAYTNGWQTEPIRLQEVEKQFAQAGITLEQPYLNPGSIDQYKPFEFQAIHV